MALTQRYSLQSIPGVYRVLDIHVVTAVCVAGLRGWQNVPQVIFERTATTGLVYIQLRQEKTCQPRCRSGVFGAEF